MKVIILQLSFLTLLSCQSVPLKPYSFYSKQMGAEFRIDLYCSSPTEARQVADKAFARIAEINGVMSDYLVDSELWQLSASAGSGQAKKVSRDLWTILKKSRQMYELSEGAFDITSGPYVLLWRQARVIKSFPAARSLQRAANKVGMDKIIFNDHNRSVELKEKGMRLDLGGIAKGYAVSEALKVVKNEGINYVLVDGGGDMAMTDHPTGSWQIFISDSEEDADEFIELEEKAIATSGDAFQSVQIDGKRYSHIVDPATGLGVTDSYRVTVIAPHCDVADALASALTVMGPEKGLRLVENLEGVDACMYKINKGKHQFFKSSGFPVLNTRN